MESALPSARYLPVSLFGSVMSVAGLALAWRLASKYYGADIAVANSIGVLAVAILGLALRTLYALCTGRFLTA